VLPDVATGLDVMPRRDRALDLRLAKHAHVRMDRSHQEDRGSSLDARHVRRLVMRATFAQRDDRALDQSPNAFDDVAVSHRHANDWNASS
jgi:hypothetical protein